MTEAVVFGRRQGVRAGAVSRHSREGGQVTQGTRDVGIVVEVRNKQTLLHPLVTHRARVCPPLARNHSITEACWPDLAAVEIVIRINRVPVIPALVVDTKPQLEKLVSEDLVTTGAVLRDKLDWDLDELTRGPALSWKITTTRHHRALICGH